LQTESLSAFVLYVISSAARWLPLQSKGTFVPLRLAWLLGLASLADIP
jgi:hypothetical protein